MAVVPQQIDLIGTEVGIRWNDGSEDFFPMAKLRAVSPSAETQGEKDIFGNQYGGGGGHDYTGVTVLRWEPVGSYAIRFIFSDGHSTGLYSFDYLKQVAEKLSSL
ncbi:MAG TPA: DUF971 domain-containing protein [Verrucomicrobiales bacterium]|nr:DUF971 domain-containing protein [Verrucomicrobiales bacterium]HIL69270.1 DUF971 domain-containing protein [Verrucomicrobiota bacterium]